MCGNLQINDATMKRIYTFICVFLLVGGQVNAQMLYPIVGTYRGQSAQGMIIWDDAAYLFSNGGHCRVISLKSGKMEREFDLACSQFKPHINSVSIGAEVSEISKNPVVYVSETDRPHKCYVEDVHSDVPILLQIIEAKEKGKVYSNHDWVVDRENQFLYGINRRWNEYLDDEGNVRNIITKYRLPKLKEGKLVTLSEKDIIDRFEVIFANGMQDVSISNWHMYIATGLHEMAQDKKGAKRAIVVINLKDKKIEKEIDLSFVTTNEPEGIDFWNRKCIVACGQNGGLYQVKYK